MAGEKIHAETERVQPIIEERPRSAVLEQIARLTIEQGADGRINTGLAI